MQMYTTRTQSCSVIYSFRLLHQQQGTRAARAKLRYREQRSHTPSYCILLTGASFRPSSREMLITSQSQAGPEVENYYFLPKQPSQLLNLKFACLNLHIQMHMAISQTNEKTRRTFKMWTSFRGQVMTKETKILIIHASTSQHTICLFHQTISSPLP